MTQPAGTCLLCDHPHGRPVPCVEPWAIVHLPRPVETITVEGDLL